MEQSSDEEEGRRAARRAQDQVRERIRQQMTVENVRLAPLSSLSGADISPFCVCFAFDLK